MKRKKRSKAQRIDARRPDVQRAFIRGFVATALLTSREGAPREVLARAVKAGVAIASGTAAAAALQQRHVAGTVAAVLAGVVTLAAADQYLTPERLEGRP